MDAKNAAVSSSRWFSSTNGAWMRRVLNLLSQTRNCCLSPFKASFSQLLLQWKQTHPSITRQLCKYGKLTIHQAVILPSTYVSEMRSSVSPFLTPSCFHIINGMHEWGGGGGGEGGGSSSGGGGGGESSIDRASVSTLCLTHKNEMFPKIKEGGKRQNERKRERGRMCWTGWKTRKRED